MIEIPTSPAYGKNFKGIPDNHLPCVVCGKMVRQPAKNYIRLFWGNFAVTEAEAIEINNPGADMEYYPVGSDCLKKYPELKPYVEDAKRALKTMEGEE